MKTFLSTLTLFFPLCLVTAQHRIDVVPGANFLQIQVINHTTLNSSSLQLQLRGENLPWFKAGSAIALPLEPLTALSTLRKQRASLSFQLTAPPPADAKVMLEVTSGGQLLGSIPLVLVSSQRGGSTHLATGAAPNDVSVEEPAADRTPSTVAEQDVLPLPTAFALRQNYPNPFNPETVIEYDLPEPSLVILSVYDLLGREVIRLVEAVQQAGRHRAAWSGRDATGNRVAGGTYLYTLSAGKQRYHGKMLLVP
jgi:hypothetical protein